MSVWLLAACAHRPPVLEDAGLTTLEGVPRSLSSLVAESDATVLVFFGTSCPCVRRYQARVEALPRQFPAPRTQVFWVSSNADDDALALSAAVQARELRVPLLVDWKGALAQQLGARSTPTVVVLDRSGRVRYRGWLDNERLPGEAGREAWAEHAIDGVLEGHDFAPRAPTWGCVITQSLSGVRTPVAPESAPDAATCR